MPILGIPASSRPPAPGVDLFADSRTLALRSLDGVDLLPFTGDEFIAEWGIQGLDKTDPDVVYTEIPGMDGARIDDVKIGARTALVPIWIGSDSGHAVFLEKKEGLRKLLDHRGVDLASTDGHFDLVATSLFGERSLRCQFLAGMSGDWTKDSYGKYWLRIPLQILAVRNYWYGRPWESPAIKVPSGRRWFGRFPPSLSSSRALGTDTSVVVGGHVPPWATADLIGPAASVTITAPGLLVNIPGGLGSGEHATVVTDPRGRTALFEGEVDWTRVGASTRWRPLKPGVAKINIAMPGASSASQAVVSGPSLYEGPW